MAAMRAPQGLGGVSPRLGEREVSVQPRFADRELGHTQATSFRG